jgi:hypothetical protein
MTAARNERDDRLRRLIARNTELEQMVNDRDELIVGLRWEIEQRDARLDEMERARYGARW